MKKILQKNHASIDFASSLFLCLKPQCRSTNWKEVANLNDNRHIPPLVPNIKFDFDVGFLTLVHSGNIEMDKLGSFVR